MSFEIIFASLAIILILTSSSFIWKKWVKGGWGDGIIISIIEVYSALVVFAVLANYFIGIPLKTISFIFLLCLLSLWIYSLITLSKVGSLTLNRNQISLLGIVILGLFLRLLPALHFYPDYFGDIAAQFHKKIAILILLKDGIPLSIYNSAIGLFGLTYWAVPPGHHVFMASIASATQIPVKWISIATTPLLGSFLILLTYLIAYKKTKDFNISLIAAFFLATAPYLVFQSSNPGSYRIPARILIYGIIFFMYSYLETRRQILLLLTFLPIIAGVVVHQIFSALFPLVMSIFLITFLQDTRGVDKKLFRIMYAAIVIFGMAAFLLFLPSISKFDGTLWEWVIRTVKIQLHYGVLILGVFYWISQRVRRKPMDFIDYVFGLFFAISLVFYRSVFYALPLASLYTILGLKEYFDKRQLKGISGMKVGAILLSLSFLLSAYMPLNYWMPKFDFYPPDEDEKEVLIYLNDLKDKEMYNVFLDVPHPLDYRGSGIFTAHSFAVWRAMPQVYYSVFMDKITVDHREEIQERSIVQKITGYFVEQKYILGGVMSEHEMAISVRTKILENCKNGKESEIFKKHNIRYVVLPKSKQCLLGNMIWENVGYKVYQISNPYYDALKWISEKTSNNAKFLASPSLAPHVGAIRHELISKSLENKNLADFSCKSGKFLQTCELLNSLKDPHLLNDTIAKYDIHYIVFDKDSDLNRYLEAGPKNKIAYENQKLFIWDLARYDKNEGI